jgi:hypothetical protein
MKTKSFFIAALMVAGIVVGSVAGDHPGTKGFAVLSTKEAEVFKVVYNAENAGKVKLNLYDEKSTLIFSESISAGGFILPLNLQGLSYGKYTIEVIDANGKKSETISYAPIVIPSYFTVRKIANATSKYVISVSGVSQKETINVRIFDASNTLVHVEAKQISEDFAQVYNLKNLKGEVTFEISNGAGKTNVVSF